MVVFAEWAIVDIAAEYSGIRGSKARQIKSIGLSASDSNIACSL
jgi:hypothetical protein